MAMTGMRLGEALAMCWENLDVRNCQYNIAETTKQGRFGPPKSGKRLIDLDAPLVAKLEARIKKIAEREFKSRYTGTLSLSGGHTTHGANCYAPGVHSGRVADPQPARP
jgi:integrase